MKKTIENRDYDKERDELFSDAFNKIKLDPRIFETINFIENMISHPQINYELITSNSGTSKIGL